MCEKLTFQQVLQWVALYDFHQSLLHRDIPDADVLHPPWHGIQINEENVKKWMMQLSKKNNAIDIAKTLATELGVDASHVFKCFLNHPSMYGNLPDLTTDASATFDMLRNHMTRLHPTQWLWLIHRHPHLVGV